MSRCQKMFMNWNRKWRNWEKESVLLKKKETGVKDPSKDPNNDEVFEIPVQMSVSESTCSCEKCTKAPDAVAALLSALFSKSEIKNCSISGKRSVKSKEPRPPLYQVRFRVLEKYFETFPAFRKKEIRKIIQNIQKVEKSVKDVNFNLKKMNKSRSQFFIEEVEEEEAVTSLLFYLLPLRRPIIPLRSPFPSQLARHLPGHLQAPWHMMWTW